MAKEYSKEIAQAVNQYLVDDDWKFYFDSSIGMFKFGMSSKRRVKNTNYIIDIKDKSFLIYGISPIGADAADKEALLKVIDFITRANYGLRNGNFEVDMDDGEIRYKCYVDCEGQMPNKAVIENSLYCTSSMIRYYNPGLIDVVFYGADPKKAVEKCEDEMTGGSSSGTASDSSGESNPASEDIAEMLARLQSRLGNSGDDLS